MCCFCNAIQVIQKLSRLSRKLSGQSRKYPAYPETFQTIRKLSRLSGKFPAYPETFQAIRKFSGSCIKYPAYPETFQAIRKISRLSGNFPGYLKNFRLSGIFPIIRKISSLSGNFPGYPEIFWIIRKISSLSGNFPGTPENFWTIRKISRLSGNFPKGRKLPSAILSVTRKNFPDAQKISGWQCHPATQVFGPLCWCLVEVLKLMLNQDSEFEIWSRFVFRTCVINSTLGYVVPLAMFHLQVHLQSEVHLH